METQELAKSVFLNWKISLATKNKRDTAISSLFDELFDSLKTIGLTNSQAKDYLEDAIKSLTPNKAIIRSTYKRSTYSKFLSETEFTVSWNERIVNKANESFLGYFPIVSQAAPIIDYKGMTKEDYREYRKFADSFPEFNINSAPTVLGEVDATI